MLYDNREYKNFKNSTRDYFKLQRHYGHKVYLFSQTWDIDIKLRNLTDEMYLLINFMGWLSIGKQIKRKIVVVKPSENNESRIADELIISPFILTPFGARIFTFIPHWVKFFDSFEAPELEHRELPWIDYPDDIPKRFIPKSMRKRHEEKFNVLEDPNVVDAARDPDPEYRVKIIDDEVPTQDDFESLSDDLIKGLFPNYDFCNKEV